MIALLMSEPFSRAHWKKSSRDFFFGIGDGVRSDSDGVKSEGRIEREGRKRDTKRECAGIIELGLAGSKPGVLRDDWQNNGTKVDR